MRKQLTYAVVPFATLVMLCVAGAPSYANGSGGTTTLSTTLSGAEEIPGPGDEDGKGTFIGKVKDNQLCYRLSAKGIEPAAAAHIHAAPAGVAGGIAVGLATPTPRSAGCITPVPDAEDTMETLSESELAAILADPSAFYVNVHNASFPAGAIRGQLS